MTQRAEVLLVIGAILIGFALLTWAVIKTPATYEVAPTQKTVIEKYCKPLPVNGMQTPDKIDI